MMLKELLTLYKVECEQQDKQVSTDDFVEWIEAQRDAYLRLSSMYEWVPSTHGMVSWIRVRQHEVYQRRYIEQQRRAGT